MKDAIDYVTAHGGLLSALLFGAISFWLLVPRPTLSRNRVVFGAVTGLISLLILALAVLRTSDDVSQGGLFYLLAGIAIISGVLTVTHGNPVYAALWFAITTLGVCGLFLLRLAPFLAAATVIVYAGAIVVTFLFVIMLAQQHGLTLYDRRAVPPLPTTIAGFVLLGVLLLTVQAWTVPAANADAPRFLPPANGFVAHELSRSENDGVSMRGLGRSLFGDYLFAVEIAGTLLLVAAVGVILIVPRRSGGQL